MTHRQPSEVISLQCVTGHASCPLLDATQDLPGPLYITLAPSGSRGGYICFQGLRASCISPNLAVRQWW